VDDKKKSEYISLFALDIPISEILAKVDVGQSDVLEARIGDSEFDRQCDIALKSHRGVLLGKIAEVEKNMLNGNYNFMGGASTPNAVIKSLQWRLNYIQEFEEAVKPVVAVEAAGIRVELIEQLEAI
jgi:hypothetical protein